MRTWPITASLLAAVCPNLAMAAPPADPVVFIERIYKLEIAGKRPEKDLRLFTPELAKLFAKDAAIANEQQAANLIDYDIICSCNDPGGLRAVPSLIQKSAANAIIRVRLTYNGNYPKFVTCKLQQSPRGWFIADIITAEKFGGSLLNTLQAGLTRNNSK